MKYIIFSDVHANFEALRAFLQTTDANSNCIRLCLGDIVGYGSSPNECLDWIHERDIPVVMGNHDYALIDENERLNFNHYAHEAIKWHAQIIRPDNLNRIKNYPFTQVVDEVVSISHSNFSIPADFIYLFDPQQALYSFSGLKTPVGFFGHTHLPTVYIEDSSQSADNRVYGEFVKGHQQTLLLEPGKRYLINPGSLGQPRDGDSRASYVIMDTQNRRCTFCRLPYNHHAESQRMLDCNLPELLARRILIGQ